MVEKDIFSRLTEVHGEIKSHLGRTEKRLTDMQKQLDAIDSNAAPRFGIGSAPKSLVEILKESETVVRLLRDKKGAGYVKFQAGDFANFMQQKATITSSAVGAMTTGVLPIDRIPGIVEEARQDLTVRDALTSTPTTMQVIDFVKVNAHMAIASPQTEASDKGENAVTFTSHSETVKTLATWVPASRQILDDFTELATFLQGSLMYYVNLEEELQLLSGSGSGQDLNGLLTQASSFNTGLLPAAAGWNKIDIVGRAIQQVMIAKELKPTFVVVHPSDWWGMRLQKDSYGRYILGDPQTALVQSALFGLKPIVTTSIASGTFLVGSGSPVAAEIRDRMEIQVEISTEHSDYFVKNLVAVRGEKRLALIVKRPASFITGSFSTSP